MSDPEKANSPVTMIEKELDRNQKALLDLSEIALGEMQACYVAERSYSRVSFGLSAAIATINIISFVPIAFFLDETPVYLAIAFPVVSSLLAIGLSTISGVRWSSRFAKRAAEFNRVKEAALFAFNRNGADWAIKVVAAKNDDRKLKAAYEIFVESSKELRKLREEGAIAKISESRQQEIN